MDRGISIEEELDRYVTEIGFYFESVEVVINWLICFVFENNYCSNRRVDLKRRKEGRKEEKEREEEEGEEIDKRIEWII